MELLKGKDLRSLIARELPSLDLATEIVRQAALGAAAAHRQGIIHRDIKPENIFIVTGIDDAPLVKLLDFGIAKMDPTVFGSGDPTASGAVPGTAPYMAPEHARGLPVDVRSDVYALGVVLYELITGRCPFRRESYNATLYQVLTGEPESVISLRPEVGADLEAVVIRAMARDPDDRFAGAEELAQALVPFTRRSGWIGSSIPGSLSATEVTDEISVTAVKSAATAPRWSPPSERKRRWRTVVGVAAMVLSLFGGGSWWVRHRRTMIPTAANAGALAVPSERDLPSRAFSVASDIAPPVGGGSGSPRVEPPVPKVRFLQPHRRSARSDLESAHVAASAVTSSTAPEDGFVRENPYER